MVKTHLTTIILTIFLASASSGFVHAAPSRGSVTLVTTDDTYVLSSNLNWNYGGEQTIWVEKSQFNDIIYEWDTWLKFNISTIPSCAIIDAATLQLHTATVIETYTVYAHSCPDTSWTEYSLTWANQPSFNQTSMSSTIVSSDNKWYSWNALDAVQSALAKGAGQVAIVLRETAIHSFLRYVTFDAKESSSGGNDAATLTVHWTTTVPELPSLIVLSAFMVGTLAGVLALKWGLTRPRAALSLIVSSVRPSERD